MDWSRMARSLTHGAILGLLGGCMGVSLQPSSPEGPKRKAGGHFLLDPACFGDRLIDPATLSTFKSR